MGFLKKIIKAPIKLHKKATKAGINIAKKTTPGMGGGGGQHLKAGTRSGGERAVARNARAAANTPRAMANTTRASATRKAPAMGATGGMSRTKVRGRMK